MVLSPTQELAKFAVNTRLTKIPREVCTKQKEQILDGLGCALGAVNSPEKKAALAAVKEMNENASAAMVWGTRERLSMHNAALVNGILVHTLEFDDSTPGSIHPAASVLPAAFAVGEKLGSSGSDLLTAIIIGYEVAIRIAIGVGPSSHRMKGWHATGTCGTFGAAAAAGHLLGLSEDQMTWALGLCSTQHTGTWVFTDDGSMCKRFHPGFASLGGIVSVYMAKAGFTGPTRGIEAKDGGFCTCTSDEYDLTRMIRDLGVDYECMGTSIKPFPCCRHMHAPLDAVLKLAHENGLNFNGIEEILVKTNSCAAHSVGWIIAPNTVTEAQFSLPYCIGVALVAGGVTLAHFTQEAVKDPKVLEIAKKVKVMADPKCDKEYPANKPTEVMIRRSNGQVLTKFLPNPPGELSNPIPKNVVEGKFRDLASAALTPQAVGKLQELIANIEIVPNVREITRVMVP